MSAWKQLLLASRPVSWVNTAYPFAAGYVVATQTVDWFWLVGTLYFLIPYNLIMYGINDVFDYESDLRNPRKGGVEGAVLDRKFHRLVVVAAIATNLPFVVVLMLGSGWAASATLLALLFFVVAYSAPYLRFKERPVLDSVTSSIHFVGPLVFALAVAGFSEAYLPYVAAFFLWGMASHAFGAVQDIVPDRQASIASVATVFGARATVWLALVLYVAASLLVAAQGGWAVVVAAAGLLYAVNAAPYVRVTDKTSGQTNAGWRRFLWLNLIAGAAVTISLLASRL